MRSKLGLILSIVLLFSLIAYPAPTTHAATSTILYQTSFEDPNDSTWQAAFTEYDTADAHTGSYSLKYTFNGTNPGLVIRLPIEAGYSYDMSVWVKTTNTPDSWPGAKIAIDAYRNWAWDWAGGKYMSAPVNTNGQWQKISLPTYTAPEGAASAVFTLYSEGASGTIQFDDLKIVETERVDPIEIGTSYQTSFEDANDSTWTPYEHTSYDVDEHHSGSQSLKYVIPSGANNPGEEGAERPGPSIKFVAEPGMAYDTSVWIKTVDTQGLWAGAMFRITVLDHNGNWLESKKHNPHGTGGEWQLLKLPTLVAGEGAEQIEITLFAYGGAGTLYFDDLSIEKSQPPLFQSKLVNPTYRGLLVPGGNPQVAITTRGAAGINKQLYTTVAQLVDQNAQVMEEQVYSGSLDVNAEFDTSSLPAGHYKVVVSSKLTGTEGGGYSQQWPIVKVQSLQEMPESYTDDQGRFWKDGELFFPIGIYTANTSKNDLEDLLGSAFNTILPYDYPDEEKLDLAHQYGMNVIFSMKDFFFQSPWAPSFIQSEEDELTAIALYVQEYKDHPALLAWYLSDETPIDNRLSAHYQTVMANDRDHPAYTVDYRWVDHYTVNDTTDLFGLDIYPVYGKPNDDLKYLGDLQKAMTADLQRKGQWAVVQAHNHGNYVSSGVDPLRPPTTEEMRNMAWQYIAEGARGVLFYSLFDLANDASGKTYDELLGNVKTVAQELKNMAPVILSAETAPEVSYNPQSWLHVMVKSYEGNTYIIAVNNSKETQQASFGAQQLSGLPVQVWNEGRTLNWNNDQFSDTFAPYAVHIYEIGNGDSIASPDRPEWATGNQLAVSNIQSTSVKLSWPSASNDTDAYYVYVDGVKKAEVAGTANEYVVPGLTASSTYTFTVTAVNAQGLQSNGLSNSATTAVAVPSTTAPQSSGGGSPPSSLKTLSQLGITANGKPLVLSPAFSADVTEYSMETAEKSVTIAAAAFGAAAMTLNGNAVDKEATVNLQEGDNKFELIVKAADGTKQVYILHIVKTGEKEPSSSNHEKASDSWKDIAGHWSEKSLLKAWEMKLIKGYPDQSFKPNQSLTRAEFSVLLMRALQATGDDNALDFTDQTQIGAWARSEVAKAVEAGIIRGYDDGSFRPGETITRAEMAVMISRALKLLDTNNQATNFADAAEIPAWAGEAVQAVQQLGIIEGRSSNRFAPNEPLTRAEAVVALLRMLEKTVEHSE
ncbi:S-layer homology domain-containing protein [Cohnella sp.]|uniref:S-layer homology domain-containing protein n=1 Tax=Cohnella sp. TaxID=1883426 RepID=UPI003703F7FA